jgi:DNA (cytosine-5)-methyltransferase 1
VDIAEELPTVISFCSGYGGIERGLDLAGVEHRVIAYVEIEAFAIANLVAKMESGQLVPAPIFTDLKTFPAHLFRDCVDIITGGYPCQPFSAAGKRLGTEDPRHLWPYILDHIRSIRPVRCMFENVEGHISLGLREVIGDLEGAGYRTAWGIFSAAEVGAPHQRKRVYILADSGSAGQQTFRDESGAKWETELTGKSGELADTISAGSQGRLSGREDTERESQLRHLGCGGTALQRGQEQSWPPEPRVGRVVDGCADRVDRIRLLGNGVVPQTAAKAWTTLTSRGKK